MKSGLALILVLTAMGCGTSLAGTLWQNTVSGMSPQELKKLYPAASAPSLIDGKQIASLHDVSIFDENLESCFTSAPIT